MNVWYRFSDGNISYKPLQIGHSAVTWILHIESRDFPREAARLDELLEHLDTKYSHQSSWNTYIELVGTLLKQGVIKSNDNEEDKSSSRTEIVNEFTKRLIKISAATLKLQTVFNEDEQRFLHLLNFEWIKLYCRKLMQWNLPPIVP